MNKHIIIGNVGATPEIVKTETTTIANFSIASSRYYKDKAGEKQQETDWIRVVAFGKRAELIEKYVDKGSKLAVIGRVKTRSYEDKSGEKRFTTETILDELEFISSNKNETGGPLSHPGPSKEEIDNAEKDDLPF